MVFFSLALLLSLLITAPQISAVEPGACRLGWVIDPPDPEIGSFRLYMSPSAHGATQGQGYREILAPETPQTLYRVSCAQFGMPMDRDGTYYLAVSAVDRQGRESVWTAELRVDLQASAVDPPQLVPERLLSPPSALLQHSGNFAATHAPAHLFDGCTQDTASCKSGNVNLPSFWVELDLGAPQRLSRVRLFGDGEGAWLSKTWSLHVRCLATDAWADVFEHYPAGASQWYEVLGPFVGVVARYLRFTVAGQAAGTEARELEVYGYPVRVGSCP